MSRFLFLVSGLALVLSFASSASSAQTASSSSGSVSKSKLTLDEAIAAIQSKEPHSGSSFWLIREVDSSAAMREAAQRSRDSASSQRVGPYRDGVFIELMRTGGFVILEVDDKSDHAISLHLVSRTANGDTLVESNPVDGEVSATLAQELIRETADLVDALFSAPINASALESKFDGSRFPESHDPDDDETSNLFAVPSDIEKIGTDQSEIRELAVLVGAIDTWPIRYALSTPLFPADPPRAIDAGARELVSLSRQFSHRKNGNLDVVHMLQDLKSVRNSEQLRNRVSTLRLLDNFLEQKLVSPDTSMTFAANRSISTIPLKLGFNGPPDISYVVMTSSGIIVGWKVSSSGAPVVTRMGLAGD
jgi:hypothetical protein